MRQFIAITEEEDEEFAQDAQQLLAGYEMTLDDLRERMQQAERTGEEQAASWSACAATFR